MKEHRTVAAILLLLLCGGCRNFEKEAARTNEQLARLARDTGADKAAEAAKDAAVSVKDTVKDVVDPATTSANQSLQAVQAYQKAKDMGERTTVVVNQYYESASRSVGDMTRSMPHSEAELERIIDDYNRDFTDWLRKNLSSGGSSSLRFSENFGSKSKTLVHKMKGRPAR